MKKNHAICVFGEFSMRGVVYSVSLVEMGLYCWCCSAIVVLVMGSSSIIGDIVVVLVLYRYCSAGVAALVFQCFCCSAGIVVLVLQ